jgi:hypothetical protein
MGFHLLPLENQTPTLKGEERSKLKPARGKIECKYRAIDITAQGWDGGSLGIEDLEIAWEQQSCSTDISRVILKKGAHGH